MKAMPPESNQIPYQGKFYASEIQHSGGSPIQPNSEAYFELKNWLDNGANRDGIAPQAVANKGVGRCSDALPPVSQRIAVDTNSQAFQDFKANIEPMLESSCAFGSCHGDFGPWNMATDGAVVEVWDWERFAASVPVGFDAAHYRTQEAFARSIEPSAAWTSMVDDVSTLLTTLRLDPDPASIAAGGYLLAICARYRSDAADAPTPTLRRRMRWLSATAAVAVQSLEGAYA